MEKTTSLSSKKHYPILDGLRGVAAIMVVAFHIFETHTTSRLDQIINHGYLAVDFFFLLSGFVISYAYDDRWSKMSVADFFKIRLARLQPMVVMGMIIGALCFYFQDSALWPMIHEVPIWKTLLVMLIGFTLIPLSPSMDIRGWQEMHPLNGPGWSLFFEYIGNILYALFVRKFSNTALAILVFLSGCLLIHLAVFGPKGDVIGGWTLNYEHLHIGFSRLLFPFFGGLLLHRIVKLTTIKNGFFWTSLLTIVVLAMPRIGGKEHLWMNGLYDSLCIIIVFPLIVFLGASGEVTGKTSTKICKFLGDISYPIYITHYPLIYIYTGWVRGSKPSSQEALPFGLLTLIGSIVLAYVCLKLYDEPVRLWLKQKILTYKLAFIPVK
ncbi:Peptidoglycan/LPS O-acetylase OafA/YrhL, contains acyltransferase and SGNH-hydrolase domains [Flavobacterium fluvii]|uniref:Peptidoglycan/LPS O-acetylase OafA/YrhL, contains acyltransferase and SGNH-hydrolase domains n=1 Tax=Flavobacterium fluvii TaxID=468056 RepID=A0A1M5E9M0_9FLAO|nr:acyltransferase [Flavobacterium fluvii]SHF75896.1 Peptidoglycan/LPS O-acetylase OafA/YrhL, contains acyltransferase and SGNH-hydrolase domains [Flavobacterium fluvii]